MDLRFFIIYTPNSFNILKFAIESLLQHSPFNFTLVGNGIGNNELQDIQSFCKYNDRLSFIDLPGSVVVPHGTALTHLFNTTEDEYFCFIDSDVFATGSFANELTELISNYDVVSSCKPIEWLIKKSKPGYRGHCTVSPSGKPVSITYFSVYKKQKVTEILTKYCISFERYMRREQVPKEVASLLTTADQYTWKFNTAKLLNIIQAYHNQTFVYQEFSNLIHLGGVSRYSENTVINQENHHIAQRAQAQDRLLMRGFFYQLLQNINDCKSLIPSVDLVDKELEAAIIQSAERLLLLHKSLESKS